MRLDLLLLLAAVTPLAAQGPTPDTTLDTTRWSPALSMKYAGVSGIDLSPDGRFVAYVVRRPVMEGDKSEYLSHVWIAAVDGSMNHQYTQGDHSASNPQFSPDGEYLAFTSSRSDKNQVWVMRVRGGEAQPVTDADPGVSAFAW